MSTNLASSLEHGPKQHSTPWVSLAAVIGFFSRLCQSVSSLLVLALMIPLGILTAHWLRRFFLIVAILNIPLAVDTYLAHREGLEELDSISGFPFSLTTVALIGLYAPLLLTLRRHVLSPNRKSPRVSLALSCYVFFAALSVLFAFDTTVGLFELSLLVQMFLFYLYITNAVNSRDAILLVITCVLVGLVLESLLMIGLAAGIGEMSFAGFRTRVDPSIVVGGLSRVGGSIGSPNQAAGYLSMALIFSLGVALADLGRWRRILALTAFGLGMVALIFTFSRGGWISTAVGLAIVVGGAFRSGRYSRRTTLSFIGIGVLLVIILSGPIWTRLTADDRGAAHSRVPLMRIASLMIQDHPVFGVGANNFAVAVPPYLTQGFMGEFQSAVHNRYLLIWSETGIGALIAVVIFLFAAIRRGTRCWRSKDPFLAPVALGCTAALVAHMCHMQVEGFRGQVVTQFAWLVAGLLVPLQALGADTPPLNVAHRPKPAGHPLT